MIRTRFVVLVTLAIPWLATSQTFPTNDPVIKNIGPRQWTQASSPCSPMSSSTWLVLGSSDLRGCSRPMTGPLKAQLMEHRGA